MSLRRARAVKTQAPRPSAPSSSGPCLTPRKQVPSPQSISLPLFLLLFAEHKFSSTFPSPVQFWDYTEKDYTEKGR